MIKSKQEHFRKYARIFCQFYTPACANNSHCMTAHCQYFAQIRCRHLKDVIVNTSKSLEMFLPTQKFTPLMKQVCTASTPPLSEFDCWQCRNKQRNSVFEPSFIQKHLNNPDEIPSIPYKIGRKSKIVQTFRFDTEEEKAMQFIEEYREKYHLYIIYSRKKNEIRVEYYDDVLGLIL